MNRNRSSHWALHLPAQSQVLVGIGSTVSLPLNTKWAEQYNKRDPNFQMRYLPLGTSEGIALVGRSSARLRRRRSSAQELRFSGEVLGEIFPGRVKTRNSAATIRN